jgi:hypothetical protein
LLVCLHCEGSVTIFQYGAGPNGVMRTLGKYMLGSGGMFGYVLSFNCFGIQTFQVTDNSPPYDSLFMSIGSVIRTEGPYNDAWLRARGPPMMLPRQHPLRSERQ